MRVKRIKDDVGIWHVDVTQLLPDNNGMTKCQYVLVFYRIYSLVMASTTRYCDLFLLPN